LIELEKVS